jgi:hypothetical protein
MPIDINAWSGKKRLLSSISALSSENWRKLQMFQPQPGDRYPAAATLSNGVTEECVIFIEKDSDSRQYVFPRRGFIRDFIIIPEDEGIEVESVVDVSKSPHSTPPDIYRRMRQRPPTHMFGYGVKFTLKDGKEFALTCGDLLEFISVPEGYTTDDVVDFSFPSWEEVKDFPWKLDAPQVKWCTFVKPE